MEVDDDVEDDDMDFNPLYREGSPSETSSSLTSEAECEGTSFENQPSTKVIPRSSPANGNTGDRLLPKESLSAKGACKENVPESTSTQLHCENGEGRVNGLGKEPLQTVPSFSPSVQNTHPGTEEDAICRRTRARYSLANYALDELETFLQESDDDGDLQNVDEEEEYRKFLSAVLSGGGDDPQACQGDETQDEDENDADFELEIEEALESDGGENVENDKNINGRNEKDGHRPQTRKKRPELSRAVNHQQESTKANLRPILPNASLTPQVPGQYLSQNINVPSSLSSATGAAVVEGFTDEQLGQLHILIYEHVQLMIQTFSLCVLDLSKQRVAADVKKMIVELVGYRDQALARKNTIRQPFCFEGQHLRSAISHAYSESSQCQWIPLIKNPIMSILDVSPLPLALGYLSDVAGAVVKYRKSHVDGTPDRIRFRKDPLFPSPVLTTGREANNVSQDRSNNVSTSTPASPGQSQPKKSLAATLFESTQKEPVALVPFDIARLAQRFYPLFNFSLFPHKPPPAAMVSRLLFTDAEDGLLALGLMEYNNDWEAIQKRFLPCKSTHQIFVRQKNRSSAKATDNPVKHVRRMKNSPLSSEEVQRIEEGLKIFKNDWTSVWKFVVPYRDPALLQRQWRVANGIQRSYSKSDALKAKRRTYEAKRRKRKASMADSQVGREQEADNDASEDVENDDYDDDLYVNEAFLADTENRSMNMMQTGTSLIGDCGSAHGHFEQHKRNSMLHGVNTAYIPFSSCASDGPSTKRVFGVILDELPASQLSREKGSHVVKLAPDLPPVNLPPSVRVISQMEFHQKAAHYNGTSDNAAQDLFPVPPPTFTECVYTQLNLFPHHSTTDRSQQHGCDRRSTEDGTEQDFQMHPLLFQHPREVLPSHSHSVQNLTSHTRNYNLFPFEKVQLEESNKQTTDGMEGAPANANTIDFHPLLQRSEAEMHVEVPEENCHPLANQSDGRMREPPVDDQSTVREASSSERETDVDMQASTSPCERDNNIDLDIHLCSSVDFRIAKDLRSTPSKSRIQPEKSVKDRASILNLQPANASSHHDTEGLGEETMQGIVMEQEELSDSEEESQHVEFECEEMDDSEDEQAQGTEPCSTTNKGTSTSVACSELQENNDQCQTQQGLKQVAKQGVRSKRKSRGSSSARPVRAKSKPTDARSTGTRKSQRSKASRTSESSQAKMQEEAGPEHKSSDPRRSRKSPAPS